MKRDEKTGETYLKLPVPTTEILDKALRAVGSLLESLRKGRWNGPAKCGRCGV